MTPRDRFDPPLLRLAFVLGRECTRDELLARLGREASDANWPADRIESALHHGGVHLSGRPHEALALPARIPAQTWVRVHAFVREPEWPPLPEPLVRFDGAGIVAIAKPPWWPVQGTRASQRLSLERVLRERLGAPRLRPVHRLDRETSGILLFARDPATAGRWGRAFARGEVEKRYLAVVRPPPARSEFTVHGWLERVPDAARFRFALAGGPARGRRESTTHVSVRSTRGSVALIDAVPVSGRTHQIRVHLAAVGSPILGDALYGDSSAPGAERCLLHAASLRARLSDGSRHEFDVPCPDDVLAALGQPVDAGREIVSVRPVHRR